MEPSSGLTWHKSSYSGSNGGDCVEVAASDGVFVRDTKDREGTLLAFGPQAWRKFTAKLQRTADLVPHPHSAAAASLVAGALSGCCATADP